MSDYERGIEDACNKIEKEIDFWSEGLIADAKSLIRSYLMEIRTLKSEDSVILIAEKPSASILSKTDETKIRQIVKEEIEEALRHVRL